MDELETMARTSGPRGEVVLRRRTQPDGSAVEELIVNGTFAMDSRETTTERRLADFAVANGARRVLVGGLGLGYTVSEILTHPVERVDVVEIETALVHWARGGLTPTLTEVAADPRVHLHAVDVAAVLGGRSGPDGPWDAIVLDVDNGPDFLIHAGNAALYGAPGLTAAYGQLAPGGTLAVWCQGEAPDLLAALDQVASQRAAPAAEAHPYEITREGRRFTYVIYALTRPGPDPAEA